MTDNVAVPTQRRTALGHSVIAVLGPTNTGKTHLAIERMLGHESGLIGLPLRLLAREVYDKVVSRVGEANVALITGEEKIKPERPRYWVCTVEAMPRDIEVDFLAIDEIQLAADPERGHVFTERLLTARGLSETLMLGASTMEGAIRDLLPGANFITRHRLSKLTYAGPKKITRLPRRSAIVAFSAGEVYALAELIRRQRGGAAVVLGALSPRTRNAQVALYQSGDVDFLVATDAIGMGLNLDVDHVAFAATRKFDGRDHRELTPNELGQIAGRAGRHINDGSFGVTGEIETLPSELVNRLEGHDFDAVKILQWRNSALEFGSLDALKESLRASPNAARLTRARAADDVMALEALSADPEIKDFARAPAAIRTLWDVCQVPDYRKISSQNHAELIGTLYKHLMGDGGTIAEDWYADQVALCDRTDGDLDTLSNRIAHIRTWTFVSNRAGWLANPDHWRERTRAIEDTLSDALHELLTQRFVDRRTSVLMKSMRDKNTLYADIENTGQIFVEKHYVGKLEGFRFTPDTAAAGLHGKAARHAAAKVLAVELTERAGRLCDAKDDVFKLERKGAVTWGGQEIGRLEASDDHLRPNFVLMADEHLATPDRDRIVKRVESWLSAVIDARLKPLVDLSKAQDVTGLAKGIAFRLVENFGILRRETVADEIRSLDQESRAELRKFGVRFGAYNIYFPLLLKPAAADLLLLLWTLRNGATAGLDLGNLPEPPRQGLTSVVADKSLAEVFYNAAGFQVCGTRAIRIDMLERLADQIRPLTSWKPTADRPEPPAGAVGRGGFKVQPEMLSIIGCSAEEMGNVLVALGFRKERRLVQPPAAKPMEAAEPVETAVPAETAAQPFDGGALATEQTATDNAPAASDEVTAADGAAPAEEAAVIAPTEIAAQEAPEPSVSAEAISSKSDEPSASPEAEAHLAAEAVASEDAAASAPPAQDAQPAEPEYEDVWRPHRRVQNDERRQSRQTSDQPKHQHERRRRSAKPQGNGAPQQRSERGAQAAGAAPGRDGPQQARPERQGGDNRPRNDRRKNDRGRDDKSRHERKVATASPPAQRGGKGADKDSPFAALMELKERMARETQDQA
jgi:ATP-dependent RNA helicase SUPV3L1/SUV3